MKRSPKVRILALVLSLLIVLAVAPAAGAATPSAPEGTPGQSDDAVPGFSEEIDQPPLIPHPLQRMPAPPPNSWITESEGSLNLHPYLDEEVQPALVSPVLLEKSMDPDKEIKLDLSILFNDTYLNSILETAGVPPQEEMSDSDYENLLAQYEEVKPLHLSFSFKDSQVKLPEGRETNRPYPLISEGDDTHLADYQWNTDGDHLVLNITTTRIVYSLKDVKFFPSFFLFPKDTSAVGNTIESWSMDDDKVISFVFSKADPETSDPKDHYELTKSQQSVDDTTVRYTVTASAKETGTLSGKVLQDILPPELILQSAEITTNGEAPIPIVPPDDAPQNISYTFPEDSTITQAELTITAILSPEIIQNHMNQNPPKLMKAVAANTASLFRTPEASEAMVDSNKETTSFSLPPLMEKDGKPNPYNSRLLDWTIDVNTYGSAEAAYIIDSIDTKNHEYTDSFTINGTDKLDLIPLNPAQPISYNDLKNSHTLQGNFIDTLGLTPGQAGYYTLGSETIAIIPIQDRIGSPLKLQYTTKLKAKPGSADVRLYNTAKLVWHGYAYEEGTQPTNPADFGWSIKKTKTTNTKAVLKSGKYQPSTQTATWTFDVNSYNAALDSVIITDTFLASSLHPKVWDSKAPIPLTYKGNGTGTLPANASYGSTLPTASGTAGYTLTETEIQGEPAIVFQMQINGLAESDYYSFNLETTVKDGAFLGTTVPSANSLTNEISTLVRYPGSTKPVEQETEATLTHRPKVLKKTAGTQSYNFQAQSLPWTITINEDKVPITQATLEDTLPEGSTVTTLTVSRNGVKLTPVTLNQQGTGTVTDGVGTIEFQLIKDVSDQGFANHTLKIDFGDRVINATYEISFSTEFEELYRRNMFTHTEPLDRIPNTVAYVDPSRINTVPLTNSATAIGKTAYPAFEKQGTYRTVKDTSAPDFGASLIDWSVAFNRYKADMTGAVFIDDFSDKPFYALDPEKVVIYELVPRIGDLWAVGSALPLEAFQPTMHTDLLRLTIPAAYAETPLLITFSTYLTGSGKDIVYRNQMTNQAQVTTADYPPVAIPPVQAKNAENFIYSDFAQSNKSPNLKIKKYSSTKSETTQAPFLPLTNATFTLTPMKKEGDQWVKDSAVRTKTTSREGEGIFTFLRADTLYLVTETSPPPGYKVTDPLYVWFSKDNPAPTELPVRQFSAANRTGLLTLTDDIADPGTLHLRQQTPDGQPLGNVVYQLVPTSHTDDFPTLSGTTDPTTGEIVFTGLEPGISYVLVQQSTPPGILPRETTQWDITVTYDPETGKTLVQGPDDLPQQEGVLLLVDAYQSSPVNLDGVFYDKGQPIPVPDAIFTLYRDDQPVGYLVWNPETQTYVPSIGNGEGLDRNNNGSYYVQPGGHLLPGEYTYVLTTTPAGYSPNTTAYPLIVPDDGSPVNYNVESGLAFVFHKPKSPGGKDDTESGPVPHGRGSRSSSTVGTHIPDANPPVQGRPQDPVKPVEPSPSPAPSSSEGDRESDPQNPSTGGIEPPAPPSHNSTTPWTVLLLSTAGVAAGLYYLQHKRKKRQ